MKKIFTVKLRNINKKPITQKLCLLSGKTPTKDIIFELFTQHSGKSSTLYLSNNKQYLLKAELTKYNRKQEFYRWISRELLKKLLFINLDARREYKGYKLVNKLGLKTPQLYDGWGVPVSRRGSMLSFILIGYEPDSISGLDYFNMLNKNERFDFIKELAKQVAVLIKGGYFHRDLHLDNFLITSRHDILWIDMHLQRKSTFKSYHERQLMKSMQGSNLGDYIYKEAFIDNLKCYIYN